MILRDVKSLYESPVIEEIQLQVETGIASTGTFSISDMQETEDW